MRRMGRRCPQCGSRWCLVWLLTGGGDPTHAPAGQPRTLAGELGGAGVEFFGPRWDAPILHGARAVEVPVGRECLSCQEPITETGRGLMRSVLRLPAEGDGWEATSEPIHAECDLRSAVGHQVGVCPCRGYETTHANAVIAWQRFRGDMR